MQQRSLHAPQLVLVMTITQVAQALGLSRGKVYQLIHEEHLPVIPFGRTMRVRPEALQEWLAQREEQTQR